MNQTKNISRALLIGLLCLHSKPILANDPYAVDERIFLDVGINGKPAKFIYDTGASLTALFEARAEKLGAAPESKQGSRIAGHAVKIGRSGPIRFSIYGKEVTTRIHTVPFRPIGGADGIMGWKQLAGSPLYIDARGRRLKAMKAIPQEGWQRWKLDSSSSQLFFELKDKETTLGRVFVDTGATSLSN